MRQTYTWKIFVAAGLIMVMGLAFLIVRRVRPDFSNDSLHLPLRSKIYACESKNGLPDFLCTPGALDSRVHQDTIMSTICIEGYTKTVRPPLVYTREIKRTQMSSYGFTDSSKHYELDHLIPLELGGSPNDIANLWPEASDPAPGYHEKDQVENFLHDEVCSRAISLAKAQEEIVFHWQSVYAALP